MTDRPRVDHLPGYDHDERTRYKARIEVDDEGVVWLGPHDTLHDVQVAYIKKRNATGLGASGFGSGDVFDERGQHLARISYNGRLWRPWSAGVMIAESPEVEA